MPSADDQPLARSITAEGREPGEPGTDASDRRAVSKYPFYGSRQMVRGCGATASAPVVTGFASHGIDGPTGDLPSAENQRSPPVASGLSLSAQGDGDREAQSGLVRRHHLHPGPARIPVPGRDHGRATRHVLAWRLSNTMDASFCVEALAEALGRYGRPEIFNTDQGSQFTGRDFTGALKDADVAISMDGRGRYMDNIFIERLCAPSTRRSTCTIRCGWLQGRTRHWRMDRLLQRRAAPWPSPARRQAEVMGPGGPWI